MLVRPPLTGTIARQYVELPGLLPHASTFVKLEGLTVTGSIKHRTALAMIDALEAEGRIGPGSHLIESTSGNFGVALASICAVRGYRITLVTDPNTNPQSVRYMRALGAHIVVVNRRDENGGYLRNRIAYVQEELARTPSLIWPNQYANPANAAAHQCNTGPEIAAEFGLPDWLFVTVGSSGTLMGLAAYLREISAPTRLVAVDAVGSVIFGGQAGKRWIPGAGASRRPELFKDDGSFHKLMVSEADAIRLCRQTARRYGLLLGGSSGLALAGVLAAAQLIEADSRVLVVSPDMGERYLDNIYCNAWVQRHFGPDVVGD
ncbi:2,3-diaminopropionate biosynthesis protein SbnA [Micromonospora sp. NPDC005413]|uniref:2,3-diaminopropionate biosynthesis protein SbnA n=1 Tax=Micromonospora sp. NPDC005413 TaxID=3154563 RepID=UPI0033BC22B1